MPGLVPGIHVLLFPGPDVDGRDKPGHDEAGVREAHMTYIANRNFSIRA